MSVTYHYWHKDRMEVDLDIEFDFYRGKTPAMGDDPDDVVIRSIKDRNGRDVLDKIALKDLEAIRERCCEYGRYG